jgi:host factor-I protein
VHPRVVVQSCVGTAAAAGASRRKVDRLSEKQDLQATFLRHCKDEKVQVSVFLTNGVKLSGLITDFDAFTLVLSRPGADQVIYKRAVSTVAPERPIALWQDAEAAARAAPRPPGRAAAPPPPEPARPPVVATTKQPTPTKIDPARLKSALDRLRRE